MMSTIAARTGQDVRGAARLRPDDQRRARRTVDDLSGRSSMLHQQPSDLEPVLIRVVLNSY